MCNQILILGFLFLFGSGLSAENSPPGPGSDSDMWTPGRAVTTWEGLAKYTGRRALGQIVGDLRKRAYQLNYDQLEINYGENVEFQLRRQQVILCPQTAEFLYSRFTPLKVRYQAGSRPVLEAVVQNRTAASQTATAKALALMRFCRDLYKKESWDTRGSADYVYGGTEEQLINKGEQLCECLGRLYVGLCEIAGIPGRIVMHTIGGHITSEIYVDGGWAYVDPRSGVYFRHPDGSLASVWELWRDPSIMRNQSESVKADASDRWTWEFRLRQCEVKYFSPNEVNGFENYSLTDAGQYGYEQLTEQQVRDRGLYKINEKYRATIDAVFGTSDAARQGLQLRQDSVKH